MPKVEAMDYGIAGSLAHHTDFRGYTTTYSYDSVTGQFLSKTLDPALSEATVSFTYNPDGTPATASRGSLTTGYTGDLKGKLTAIVEPYGSLVYTDDYAGDRTRFRQLPGANPHQYAMRFSPITGSRA